MKIAAIAWTTFKESARQRILYLLLGMGVLLIVIVGQLPMFTFSVLDDVKMLKDMAVSTMTLVGLLMAIFAAVHVITEEIENWTVVTVLSKPVRRWEFVTGKYLGLVTMLAAAYAVMSVIFLLLLWWGMYGHFTEYGNVYPEYVQNFWSDFAWQTANQMWRGFLLSFFQVVVLAAVAVALCVRLPMVVAVVIYFGVFVTGQMMEGALGLAQQAGPVLQGITTTLSFLLANLGTFNVAYEVAVEREVIPVSLIVLSGIYAAMYSGAALLTGVLLFRNREVF